MIIVLLLLLLPVFGCTTSADLALSDPLAIDGVYSSTSAVGALGNLELTITKRPTAIRVFEAVLHSDNVEIADSEGRGTLGNLHLILNFEIGQTDDYYFQGFVQQDSGGTVTGLSGSFIFPGQDEQLDVEFTRTGDAPPVEEEE